MTSYPHSLVLESVSDLVGTQNCWFSHAVAHFKTVIKEVVAFCFAKTRKKVHEKTVQHDKAILAIHVYEPQSEKKTVLMVSNQRATYKHRRRLEAGNSGSRK